MQQHDYMHEYSIKPGGSVVVEKSSRE